MMWKLWTANAAILAARAAPEVVAGPEQQSFVAGTSVNVPMKPAPIEPSWILEGAPVARIFEHSRGEDDAAVTALWDCTAGTFRWYFGWDETVMILEGEVHITTEDGQKRTLRTGDVAYFKGRTWATWKIDNYLKKVAFCRKPFPKPLAMAYRLKNFLRNSAASGFAA